jgi:hypothetical protein
MLLRETIALYFENRNTQRHCMGRMQSFSMLKKAVHIVTTGLYKRLIQKLILNWNGPEGIDRKDEYEIGLIFNNRFI